MGFGFGNEDEGPEENKELKHEYTDTLKYIGYRSITVGMRVQSVLNGMTGEVVDKDKFKHIHIAWDNGNKSRAAITELTKVIAT